MPENNILYNFSLVKNPGRSAMGINLWLINKLFIVMLIFAVPFLVLTFTNHPAFIIFAVMFVLLGLLFGPYAKWLKNSYTVTYYDNDTLLLKSTINFLPNNYTVNLKLVSVIERENPLIAQAIAFKDLSNKKSGRFNHLLMGPNELNILLNLIRQRNNQIQIKI